MGSVRWTNPILTLSRCPESLYLDGRIFLLHNPQVILDLLIEPTFRGGTEGLGQPNGHFRADSRPSVQDSGEGFTRDSECLGGGGDTQPKGFKAELLQDFPRMGGIVHFHKGSLMVILVIHIDRIAFLELEGNPPIAADGYRPGSLSRAHELMQAQSGEIHIKR